VSLDIGLGGSVVSTLPPSHSIHKSSKDSDRESFWTKILHLRSISRERAAAWVRGRPGVVGDRPPTVQRQTKQAKKNSTPLHTNKPMDMTTIRSDIEPSMRQCLYKAL
jgi:hypothetical protein